MLELDCTEAETFRYLVYRQTVEGRYLFVVLESIGGTMYKPITARNMTSMKNETLGGAENERTPGP